MLGLGRGWGRRFPWGFPADTAPQPRALSEIRRGHISFRRPQGGRKAWALGPSEKGDGQRLLSCPLSKPSTRQLWCTT